jgi:hypothetical protein
MQISPERRVGLFLVGLMTGLILSGCGANTATLIQPVQQIVQAGLSGQVRSGLRAVTNAQIYLYAAGLSGGASAAMSLLKSEVFSDGSGNFSLANNYTCNAGQQLYVVAIGGNTGTTVNPNAALMAALGDCASITSSTFTVLNEVTTVASVFALAPFMSSYANIGAPSSNAKGLASAFATVNKLVDVTKGSASGPALPADATIDTAKINSLANIVVQCMHSAGGRSGDGSPCGLLFSLVVADGTSAPTDTIGSALSIARNPAKVTDALFAFARMSAPFSPQLAAAPADWSLAITYRGGGFNTPSSTSVDKEGNIWVANAGNSTVSVLAQSGIPVFDPLSGNSLNHPVAIAIDASDQAWVVNNGGSSVSIFQANGAAGSTPSAAVGSKPTAIAVDPLGAIWVANSASNSLTKLNSDGSVMTTVTSHVNFPSGIAINTH